MSFQRSLRLLWSGVYVQACERTNPTYNNGFLKLHLSCVVFLSWQVYKLDGWASLSPAFPSEQTCYSSTR